MAVHQTTVFPQSLKQLRKETSGNRMRFLHLKKDNRPKELDRRINATPCRKLPHDKNNNPKFFS